MAALMRSREDTMMQQATAITCVFLDIGSVLLTNGWDHHARQRAATHFKQNPRSLRRNSPWRKPPYRHVSVPRPRVFSPQIFQELLSRWSGPRWRIGIT